MEDGGCKIEQSEHVLIGVYARQFDEAVKDDKTMPTVFFTPGFHEADETHLLPFRRAQDIGWNNLIVSQVPQRFLRESFFEFPQIEPFALRVESLALQVNLFDGRKEVLRPELLRERAVVSFNVRVRVRLIGGGEEWSDAKVQEEFQKRPNVRLRPSSSPERHSVVHPHHVRYRESLPKCCEKVRSALSGFGQNTAYLIEFQELVVARSEYGNWLCPPCDELLSYEVA